MIIVFCTLNMPSFFLLLLLTFHTLSIQLLISILLSFWSLLFKFLFLQEKREESLKIHLKQTKCQHLKFLIFSNYFRTNSSAKHNPWLEWDIAEFLRVRESKNPFLEQGKGTYSALWNWFGSHKWSKFHQWMIQPTDEGICLDQ